LPAVEEALDRLVREGRIRVKYIRYDGKKVYVLAPEH
jgi:hypothetical protein